MRTDVTSRGVVPRVSLPKFSLRIHVRRRLTADADAVPLRSGVLRRSTRRLEWTAESIEEKEHAEGFVDSVLTDAPGEVDWDRSRTWAATTREQILRSNELQTRTRFFVVSFVIDSMPLF